MLRERAGLLALTLLIAAPALNAHKSAAKADPVWISADWRQADHTSTTKIAIHLKRHLASDAQCRANERGILCRSEQGWKELNLIKRAHARKFLVENHGGLWSLGFSDGVRMTQPEEKERQAKAVRRSTRSRRPTSRHSAVVAEISGEDTELRDGLNAIVSMQSRHYSRRNPAGISNIHGRVDTPEESIQIGANLWKQYKRALTRRNSSLVSEFAQRGDVNTLVALAYRYGPGRVLKWAKGSVLSLPTKARQFASSFQALLGSNSSTEEAAKEEVVHTVPQRSEKSIPITRVRRGVSVPHTHPETRPVTRVRRERRLPATTIRAAAPGRLKLYNRNTKQAISINFNGGRVNGSDQVALDNIMRDRLGRSGPISPKLVSILLKIQRNFDGATIEIVSGYRSSEYNQQLIAASKRRNGGRSGVAKRSRHLHGDAADIIVRGVSVAALHRYALSLKAGGVGKYSGWVHVDAGRVRRW